MNIKENAAKLLEKVKKDKKLLAIVAVGLLGMLILLLTEIGGSTKSKQEPAQPDPTVQQAETYAEDVEKRLTQLICAIQGVGDAKVMVTLESGLEQVYAQNESKKIEESLDTVVQEKDLDEAYEYVLIKTADGDQGGLILKVLQPKIRGVAVVCEGAQSASVRQQILETVTAVLDVSSSRVSVVQMD